MYDFRGIPIWSVPPSATAAPGSYSGSCSGCLINNATLTCETCGDCSGSSTKSPSINLTSCGVGYLIINRCGSLMCPPPPPPSPPLPPKPPFPEPPPPFPPATWLLRGTCPAGMTFAGSACIITTNQKMFSFGGKVYLTPQSDGNLVLYWNDKAIWASGTHGTSSSYKFALQEVLGRPPSNDRTDISLLAHI